MLISRNKAQYWQMSVFFILFFFYCCTLGNADVLTMFCHSRIDYIVGYDPKSVALGDFNNDGYQDLAVVNYNSHNVSILLGNGDGTFQGIQSYETGQYPNSLAIGDYNRNGKQDLAVARSNHVSIMSGNGDGSFQTAIIYPVGNSACSIVAGYFDNNAYQDLAIVNEGSNNVSILLA